MAELKETRGSETRAAIPDEGGGYPIRRRSPSEAEAYREGLQAGYQQALAVIKSSIERIEAAAKVGGGANL